MSISHRTEILLASEVLVSEAMQPAQRGHGGGRRNGRRSRDSGGHGEERRTLVPVEATHRASTSGSVPPRPPPVAVESEVGPWSGDLQGQMSRKPAAPPLDVAPSSSRFIAPPSRPGFGTLGRKVTLVTNHFPVKVSKQTIFHYDVSSRS